MLPLRVGAARVMLLVACVAAAPSVGAQNSSTTVEQLFDSAGEAFFHVEVNGTPRLEGNPHHVSVRVGKGFAVGPDLIVTAGHVVGDESQWRLRTDLEPQVLRAVVPLDREVVVYRAGSPPLREGVVVQTAPVGTFDAAALSVPNLPMQSWYDLSLCQIRDGQTYSALVSTSTTPEAPNSVDRVDLIQLTAVGYDPEEYGGLYIFMPAGAREVERFTPQEWGHDGSPIFDGDNTVVAIVSAVVGTGSDTRVLATPIQPLLPGAARLLAQAPTLDNAPRLGVGCSMVETVRQINDHIRSHAVWTIEAERIRNDLGELKPTGHILFSYDNILPLASVAKIDVELYVHGQERSGSDVNRIILDTEHERHRISLDPDRDGGRLFVMQDIPEILEPYREQLDRKSEGGSLWHVEVQVQATLVGKDKPESKVVVRNLPVSEFE